VLPQTPYLDFRTQGRGEVMGRWGKKGEGEMRKRGGVVPHPKQKYRCTTVLLVI